MGSTTGVPGRPGWPSASRAAWMALVASAIWSLGNEQHLPDMPLLVEVAMRLHGLAHREGPVHQDLDDPVPDEVHGRPQLVRRRYPEADDAPAVLEQLDHVEIYGLARVRAAGDQH